MRTQAVSCLAVRAYKHLGNAKCQDNASICKPLFGFFGFGFSSLRKFTRYCRSVSMPQHWTNSNSWIQVDPGARCPVLSAMPSDKYPMGAGSPKQGYCDTSLLTKHQWCKPQARPILCLLMSRFPNHIETIFKSV